MATRKNAAHWSNDETQTFLYVVADEKIQRELDGAMRNEKVYREVAELLATYGYKRTYQQCREKYKKLKSDYRSIKDHDDSNRKSWRWFDQMDTIHRNRPVQRREGSLDSATASLESIMSEDCRGEWHGDQEDLTALREMQRADGKQHQQLNQAQQEQHLQTALDDVVRPRELEAAVRREGKDETAAFNQALAELSQLMQASTPAPALTPTPEKSCAKITPKHAFIGTGRRRREQDHLTILKEMQVVDVEQQELDRIQQQLNREQREQHFQMALDDVVQARELEAALRREENVETAAFNQAFLATLGQLVQVQRAASTALGLDPFPLPRD